MLPHLPAGPLWAGHGGQCYSWGSSRVTRGLCCSEAPQPRGWQAQQSQGQEDPLLTQLPPAVPTLPVTFESCGVGILPHRRFREAQGPVLLQHVKLPDREARCWFQGQRAGRVQAGEVGGRCRLPQGGSTGPGLGRKPFLP